MNNLFIPHIITHRYRSYNYFFDFYSDKISIIMQDIDNSGQFLMPITGHISSSELGLATKKLLTQRFEFDMREMDGVEMEILTKSIFIDL